VGFAGDGGDFLRAEEEADGGECCGRLGEEGVVIATAATEAMALRIEGHAGNEDAVEFDEGDAGAAQRFGFAQSEGTGDDDVVPTGDLMPIKDGCGAAIDHERKGDALSLGPGFFDQGMDVGFGGKRSEEGDAAALRKGGEVGGELADDEGGLCMRGGGDGAEAGADFAAEGFLGAGHGEEDLDRRNMKDMMEICGFVVKRVGAR